MGGFSFAPEDVSGNSLSQASRAGTNALGSMGQSMGQTSQGLLNPASQYWMSILSGNPAQTSAALAPDISRIRGGEASVLNSASTLAPRGGGRGATLFGAPLQAEAQTQGLFNAARPQAAQAAGNLGVETGKMSEQATQDMLRDYLQRRGYNLQEDLYGPKGTFVRGLARGGSNMATGGMAGTGG
jgi:hypothetical protein